MQEEESAILGQRDTDGKRGFRPPGTVLNLGTALGLFISAVAGLSALRDNYRRALAETALRSSEEKYRTLMNGVRDYAIFMLDPQGQILSWSAGAERIHGYDAKQIVGRNYSCFFTPEDVERGRPDEVLRLTVSNGQHQEQAMRVRRDGSRFLADLSVAALRDPIGNLVGFSELSHDLSKSAGLEAKYRGLLEAAPDAMVVVDEQGQIVLLNVQAEKQFGYRNNELLGQQVKHIIPEGFAERLIADGTRSASEALAQQIGTGIELLGRRKDGSDFPIEIMLSPLEIDGEVLVTAAIRSISARKDSEARYRGLLEAAPDAMVVVNQGGKIVLLNVQAEKQFGYRRDELVAQPVTNIIPEGFAERLIADGTRSAPEALAQQIGTGIELLGRRKDGSEFPIEIMLSPLEIDGEVLVTAAIRNMSARKKAQEELKASNALLAESHQELEAFTYTAAHDLRAPLRHMHGFVSLLRQSSSDKLDEEGRHFVEAIATSTKRMGILLDDLLNFSHLGRSEMRQDRVCLTEEVRLIRESLEPESQRRGLTWEIGELPEVEGDATLLHQALFNLISNAVKYTRKKDDARIEIGSQSGTENNFHVFVRDNGAGFDMQYADKLFHVFQRLHTAEDFEGTGIGLAIVRRIVGRHGGKVWAEGVLGQGATFYISLPNKRVK